MSSLSHARMLGFIVLAVVTVANIGPCETATAAWSPVQWITIGKAKPVNYYLTLLKSNGTQPYLQLASELRALPEFEPYVQFANATALAQITYLALNATNPEVKEAFQLMMNGGSPDSQDFSYSVPIYNTELEVLYWLANSVQFKRDDTLVLAVAMTEGIWLTLGDQNVAAAVKGDALGYLIFLRETDELQKQRGYFDLERYPLEAKIALAWRGDQSSVWSYDDPRDFLNKPMDVAAYRWATIEVSTFYQMRDLMDRKGWIQSSTSDTIAGLENLFFTGSDRLWIYPSGNQEIVINGTSVVDHNFNSADLEFQYYLQHGEGIGWCSDEMGFLSALSKSWGIATVSLWGDRMVGGTKLIGHTHVVFFDPSNFRWKADSSQLTIDALNQFNHFYVFKPKIVLSGFAQSAQGEASGDVFSRFLMTQTDVNVAFSMFYNGILTSQMKEWLLYS